MDYALRSFRFNSLHGLEDICDEENLVHIHGKEFGAQDKEFLYRLAENHILTPTGNYGRIKKTMIESGKNPQEFLSPQYAIAYVFLARHLRSLTDFDSHYFG
jgi:hypothetical protein